MKRSRWAFLLLAATAVLFGQRAEASRTPLTDVRAAITQPRQLTAPAAAAEMPADAWLVESITPLCHTDDGQPIVLISLLIPTAHLAEHTPNIKGHTDDSFLIAIDFWICDGVVVGWLG